MTKNRDAALAYAKENKDRFLDELIELVKIPSISTEPKYKNDVKAAADWAAAKLKNIGMENIQILETGGHPVVFAENHSAGESAPTVTIYGHYDVQPSDPDELWKSPAFEPVVKGDRLYGRGASDMKGQVMASIHAVDAVMKSGGLPVNVKFFLEGEEEVGSINLSAFIDKHKELLACDFALNPDGGMLREDLPTIVYALRGLVYLEIRMTGPEHDLHSGMYGGTVINPANELARLIGTMHDEQGRVTIPGFYNKVRELDEDERKELARQPKDPAFYMEQTGSPALWGEKGYTPFEQASARPTLDVNGFLSGFIGEGSKTVLPSKSMAKVSMRLVPDQDPAEIKALFEKYLKDNARPGVTWEVIDHSMTPPSISERDSAGIQALAKGLENVWGVKPVFSRVGGSIPVVADMQSKMGVESVLTGFGLPDDNLHAPNEKLSLPTWYKGIDALIHFFYNLA